MDQDYVKWFRPHCPNCGKKSTLHSIGSGRTATAEYTEYACVHCGGSWSEHSTKQGYLVETRASNCRSSIV